MNKSVKFIIVGVLNTLVGFVVYAGFIQFVNRNYFIALVFSHIVGVAHSYLWNNKWTFGQKNYQAKSAAKFVVVYIFTFLVNLFLLFILVDTMGTNKLIAQGIALFITTLISFFAHKHWSFQNKSESEGVQ
ncbi:putative flippase GtrA [Fontibacillus phaseoli]|uniref:Putative flippase GtrA n=1 Tax=Fontibacillus phaseoli TaxID=1416533 RepID=A0A369BH52_9BACL|nr:GtrA family protein [Fontibacillus phaseoli]RCX19014.1 putative flippase GtrA [Fontibacillus phaseoli]